jgi:tryptophan synthase alpha chain
MTIRDTILAKRNNVLNIYVTAGYPKLDSTVEAIRYLDEYGADLIELGMPYSDPLADGPTIQKSSALALKNGMTIDKLFEQVQTARKHTNIPIIIMGYYNQLLQYGVERFLQNAHRAGIQGLIIPDLPMDIYQQEYQALFMKYQMEISFLITPQTSNVRILKAAQLSSAFLYVVSQTSITGSNQDIDQSKLCYFEKIKSMNLKTPALIGFGIHDHDSFSNACQYTHGAIIGSAFIRALESCNDIEQCVREFIDGIVMG